jgi:hypothetical protein
MKVNSVVSNPAATIEGTNAFVPGRTVNWILFSLQS